MLLKPYEDSIAAEKRAQVAFVEVLGSRLQNIKKVFRTECIPDGRNLFCHSCLCDK